MYRKFVAALLAGVLLVAATSDAHAAFFTTVGTVDATINIDGTGGPLANIEFLFSRGNAFTNQVEGAAFAAGNEVRSISAARILEAVNGSASPVFSRDNAGNQFIAVSALQGTIFTTPAGLPAASFTAGRLFLLEVSAIDATGTGTGFEPRNPSSWGFSSASVIAEWALGPKSSVVPGDGSDVGASGTVMNTASADPLNFTEQPGRFLFVEDSGAMQDPGDDFINTAIEDAIEGLFADIKQTLEREDFDAAGTDDIKDDETPGGFDAADLDALNDIAAEAGFGNLGGAGTAFATGAGGAAATDWNPVFSSAPTGDHRSIFSGSSHIVATPEPSSIALLCIGGGVGLCVRLRRRRQSRA